ncbi:MAG: uL15 family ribosomal protein [Candidatus Pacebacteria bacterium]|nr:uL15 family ribosomal protein [Candidatus Paceibacterota bacterium]
MQIHQLKPIHRVKRKKRVGRGGKRGTYSGRGQKGQKSRAGRKMAPIVREVIKRYPKLKGYRRKNINNKIIVFNLDLLNKKFNDSETISLKTLAEKGLISVKDRRNYSVKILGKGDIDKKLVIEGIKFSKTAKDKIEKLKGIVK